MATDIEIERRWLLPCFPKECETWDLVTIRQGYIIGTDAARSLRVRITDDRIDGRVMTTSCELTQKTGKGMVRVEKTQPISEAVAQMLWEMTGHRVNKRRYTDGTWELDVFFGGKLEGIIMLEREMQSDDEQVEMPPWAAGAIEMTDYVSNKDLAMGGPAVASLLKLIAGNKHS